MPPVIGRVVDRTLHAAVATSAVLAVLCAAGAAFAYANGYRVNTTASMPLGVWHVTPTTTVERGDVVWVCPPSNATFREARRFGFVPAGFCPGDFNPLLKPVAAVAGDRVLVEDRGVSVNGRLLANSAPARKDAMGRFLPRVPRRAYTVKPGQVWLISTYNAASFDSRYFGPLATDLIVGVADPVATREAL
jgi:conjugative transfer signal peptidase TraF